MTQGVVHSAAGMRPADSGPPPCDIEAERAVLAALGADPSVAADAAVVDEVLAVCPPSAFFDPRHVRIAMAAATLRSEGALPDSVAIGRWLKEHPAPNPGIDRGCIILISELEGSPAVGDPIGHARRVADLASLRGVLAVLDEAVAHGRNGVSSTGGLLQVLRTQLDAFPQPDTGISPTTTVDEVTKRMRGCGERIPLGFAPLDALSRGGVFPDFRIFIGGAPGTGKTGLCSQLAFGLASAGWCVRWIAADEGPEEILTRWLQQNGIPQDDAERLSTAEAQKTAEAICGLDIRFAETPYLDANLNWTEGNPNRVVVVDSLQQCLVRGTEGSEPRARVDASLKAIKRLFSDKRILTIATSELARGAYRNQASQDATDPLAAAKESGGIEYHASILAIMRSLKETPDVVEVVVPKVRRGGRRGDFTLRLDRGRCEFVEEKVDGGAASLAHDRALDKLATEVLALLRGRPGGMNVTALRGELRGRPGEGGVRSERLSAALARLEHAGAARSQPGPNRSTRWFAVGTSSGGTCGND